MITEEIKEMVNEKDSEIQLEFDLLDIKADMQLDFNFEKSVSLYNNLDYQSCLQNFDLKIEEKPINAIPLSYKSIYFLFVICFLRFPSSDVSLPFKPQTQGMKLEPKDLSMTRLQRNTRRNTAANPKFNPENFFGAKRASKLLEENHISLENSITLNSNAPFASSNVRFFTPRRIRDPQRFQNFSSSKSLVRLEDNKKVKQLIQTSNTRTLLNNSSGGNIGMNSLDSPKLESSKKFNSVHDNNRKSQCFNELSNFLSLDGFLEPIRETHTKEVENDKVYSKQDLKNCKLLF